MSQPTSPPPSNLSFDYSEFLQYMQDAEADIINFDYNNPWALESFARLHACLHALLNASISVATFMSGCESAHGTPGAIIYGYILQSVDVVYKFFNCGLFFANVATNGYGEALLRQLSRDRRNLTRTEATDFVDSLDRVDVADIPKDSMKCSHCWRKFDEVVEGHDNRPVRLPCDHRHIIGRDCLIEGLTSGWLCPLCGTNIIAVGG
jgi:hypothetical protein